MTALSSLNVSFKCGEVFMNRTLTFELENAVMSTAKRRPLLILLVFYFKMFLQNFTDLQCDRENREHLKYVRNVYCF